MADFWPQPKPAITVTRAILTAGLPNIPVSSEQPKTRPKKYIVVSLLNTINDNPAFTVPRPLIECWAETSEQAELLANQAVKVLRNAQGRFADAWVKRMRDIQGPVPLNDPDIQDRRRFQFHGDLYLSNN